ncbi:hypothetical protein, partial [Klebsiella pneumoniae]|uniref:hypothetical protein n=1 Tax=Klebsiella pneumoniae TaxID=573 RepID=UPI001966D857
MDGFINYPLLERLRPAFDQVDKPIDELFTAEDEINSIYHDPYLMGNFMDNQHTARFTHDAITKNQHPGPRWKLALTYLYTTPGI